MSASAQQRGPALIAERNQAVNPAQYRCASDTTLLRQLRNEGTYCDLGDRRSQAYVLCQFGVMRRETGDYPAAAQLLDEALGILRELGDRAGEPEALNEKGTLHRASGDLTQASGCHQRALEQARAIASPWTEAQALAGLGRCALAAGHATEAETLLRQALEIIQRIGAVEAVGVSAELDAAIEAQPAAPG